jgi:hypothetical protein
VRSVLQTAAQLFDCSISSVLQKCVQHKCEACFLLITILVYWSVKVWWHINVFDGAICSFTATDVSSGMCLKFGL